MARRSTAAFAHASFAATLSLIAGAACSSSDPATSASTEAGATRCAGTYAIAALSDYSSSTLATFGVDTASTFSQAVDLGQDPSLSDSNGHLYWVTRDHDTIFPLDSCGKSTGAIDLRPANALQTTLDPQDLAVASDGALWIAMFDVPEVQIRDAASVRSTIDLSSYDADKNPNASSIDIVTTSRGEEAFVALERLTGSSYLPTQASSILAIDVATSTVEKNIPLAGRNPFGLPVLSGHELYFAEPGSITSSTCNCDAVHEPFAGIERFDTEAESGTLIATESALGGSVIEVAVSADGACGVAIVADGSQANLTTLVKFDPQATVDAGATATTTTILYPQTAGFDLSGLAWSNVQDAETLLVGDRTNVGGTYGIHTFVRSASPSCALTRKMPDLPMTVPPVAIRAVAND